MVEGQAVGHLVGEGGGGMRARVPADVEMPDRIFAGLTARQIAILSLTVLLLWAAYVTVGFRIHIAVFGMVAAPFAAAGLAFAMSSQAGIGLEKLLIFAGRYLSKPRLRVQAPEGVAQLRSAGKIAKRIAPMGLPLQGLASDGVLDLGREGSAVLGRCSAVNFSLRSEDERGALVAAFGRLLNSLTGPVQFLVRTESVDIEATIGALESSSQFLPHPGLSNSAEEHATFLRSLASDESSLRRRLFICFRDSADAISAGPRLLRRVDEASSILLGAGVRFERLTSEALLPEIQSALNEGVSTLSLSSLANDIVKGATR